MIPPASSAFDLYLTPNTLPTFTPIAESVKVGKNCKLGVGEEKPNNYKPDVYAFGLCTIGEDSVIPDGVSIGKNTAISGKTELSDYPNGLLDSGETLIKAGDKV